MELDVVDAAFEGPLFRGGDEVFTDGVLEDVVPLFGGRFVVAEAVMPTAGLESPGGILVEFAELLFPVPDPFLDGFGGVGRKAEWSGMSR
jgi:hypothetical protein